MKIASFYDFLAENQFLPTLCVRYGNMFKIWMSGFNYDVKVTSYVNGWYLFWYQWKEETLNYGIYIGSKYKGIGRLLL